MERLKIVTKKEHTPLVVGVGKAINAQKGIYQEYATHFTEW